MLKFPGLLRVELSLPLIYRPNSTESIRLQVGLHRVQPVAWVLRDSESVFLTHDCYAAQDRLALRGSEVDCEFASDGDVFELSH